MSYAMSLLKQQIARRLGGRCWIDLKKGKAMSFVGDPLTEATSCADCAGYCERAHATGLVGSTLKMEVIAYDDTTAKIHWACPGCGRDTQETAPLLKSQEIAKEIEADPLCFTCRSKAQSQTHNTEVTGARA